MLSSYQTVPPLPTNVSALPGETRTPEIVFFSHVVYCVSKTKWLGEKYPTICTLYLIIQTYCLQKLLKLVDTRRR